MATEKRLIDANSLIGEFRWLESQMSDCQKYEIRDHIQRIEDAPTVDAVEVVRCKDCVHCENEICKNPFGLLLTSRDSFCSYGERKENESD